ncbi:hypothetical protein N7475_006463 [Penicillium sp. IBT 31633x]|nr:hypothetical protein N7475_006463 [Penicillium sp. IBT 31633x]
MALLSWTKLRRGIAASNRCLLNLVYKTKTYNSEDSLVVTHPTTNSPACGLSTAERTGSPVLHTLWSYVLDNLLENIIEC